jgi:hypothetical protein
MTDDKPDTTTLSGAEFQRHAGTDAEKWAEALFDALYYGEKEAGTAVERAARKKGWREEHIALAARFLRDYAEVCVAEEVGRVTARLVPRHDD